MEAWVRFGGDHMDSKLCSLKPLISFDMIDTERVLPDPTLLIDVSIECLFPLR